MARKFTNPFARTPAQLKADQHAPAVEAYMRAHPEIDKFTLGELKLAVPAAAADLNQNVMNEIVSLVGGIQIENPTDPDA